MTPLKGSSALDFIKTGCTLLDLVIGGGWPLGRIVNIVGDKSTGKTLLAIEAATNFLQAYKKGKVWYRETESAFDKEYASTLGMPIDRVSFGKKFDTVEEFFDDLQAKAKWSQRTGRPGLYILDSLDALSDESEMERDINKGSYGADKAKKMSTLFRKLTRLVERAQICVIIISQVRDKIGMAFGRKHTRSGGKALDFYSSVTIYLSHIKTLKMTIKGQKRAYGVRIRAKCDKNKIGLPFRECDFDIRFAFGIDNLKANLLFLKAAKRLNEAELNRKIAKELIASSARMERKQFFHWDRVTDGIVRRVWDDIEQGFMPRFKKYDDA